MADADTIERRYRSDIEVAEGWKEANPERYAEELNKAQTRRADSYAEMAQEAQATARQATLSQARSEALKAFPQADPDAVTGDSPESIRASAERSHTFVTKAREDATKAALEARRPQTRQAWTGRTDGRQVGIPGGELRGEEKSRLQEQAESVYGRTAEIIREARQPGTLRRYSDDTLADLRAADAEATAFANYRLLHPDSGLSDAAMRARAQGTIQTAPGELAPEDKRG